jgi:hypothetical protein
VPENLEITDISIRFVGASRLGEIPDQSESADSFQGSGTGWNGTFQSFLSELIPIDSQYLIKTSINYAIKRLKTIVRPL